MITWEANYGKQVLREDSGARYRDIDRKRLISFRIVDGPTILMDVALSNPNKFAYRRRTIVTGGVKNVQYLVGDVQHGSCAIYDTASSRIFSGTFGDEHPVAKFDPPVPHPYEGEMF
ncbi:MAG: hypothetical protein DRI65_16660 [Chloroflexota bacterium]|nr:MAG: hypothetical protein DRI65_16660 [Chloroflexota bacterium]